MARPKPAPKRRKAPPPPIAGGRLWRWRRWVFLPVLMFAVGAVIGLLELTRIPLPAAHPLAQTTFLYDSSGHQIASFSEQNRVNIPLTQVAPIAISAVVSTEDRHFFTEGGVNPVSMVRALLADAMGSGGLQGGSTITQQFVKQTYLTSQRTLSRKIKEAGLAVRVSRDMSKNDILQGYLNTIYWGRGAYGIEAAAGTYFGTTARQLTLPEAALLAGMIREPDLADPSDDPVTAHRNQHDTLMALVRDRKITPAQAAAAEAVPYSSFVKSPGHASGPTLNAPHGEDYFIEAVRQQLILKYGAPAVDGGGLHVTTTLDPALQAVAYSSIYGPQMPALNPLGTKGRDPAGALVSMDDNGQVKALVGGQDYNATNVDLALGKAGGGGGRQPGSTFKAIMLAELIKLGYSPQSVFPAPPAVEIPHGDVNGAPYTVTNFEHEATAPQMSIVDATADSVNTVYLQIADRIGPSNLDAMAQALGIKPSELGDDLSEVLGTDEVSPLEMDAAFATFASGGVYHTPLLITSVTDASGHSLPLPVTPSARAVLTPKQAAVETYVLRQVVLRGTGTAAGGILGTDVAGKTGTTDNSANAWFIGYTPTLTTAVWMGYPNGFRPMVNYRGLKSVQGGTIPAQLWHDYMAAAVGVQPQWAGRFPALYYLGGITLSPPAAGTVLYPEGLGTTTTTASSSTTTTTVPGAGAGAGAGAGGGAGGGAGASTTTRPKASTTTAPGGKPGPTTTTTTSSATTKPATTSTTAKPPHV
jgi:penicillin-binding protein 1A